MERHGHPSLDKNTFGSCKQQSIVQDNMLPAISLIECTVQLCKKLLNQCDNKKCDRIRCARTKLEALITRVLADFSLEKQLENLKKPFVKFSVGTDGASHGTEKLFPTMVQYFDVNKGIVSSILDFNSLPIMRLLTLLITCSLRIWKVRKLRIIWRQHKYKLWWA